MKTVFPHNILRAATLALLTLFPIPSVIGAQATYSTPTTGPMSFGTFVSTYLNPALAAILSNNSGSSAPSVTDQPGAYQWWVDTSTTPKTLKVYDGSSWLALATIDTSGHVLALNGSTLKLFGSSSGNTVLQPSAAASGTLTLPAATDTLIGKATTDTLTNKTFDTAGTGNSFSINGVAATANTGTGAVVRAISPALTTPNLGTPSAVNLSNGTSLPLSALANLGTTTTLLHGNAVGNPSFGAVVSGDLNITGTTCTNQFLTALSSAAAGTCTTDTLAGAQHANQGTTTTVLHGNAAGNPSWAAVSLVNDVTGILGSSNGGSGTITGALKANGSGTVSQAAASDLSNGTTGSGSVVLAAGPTLSGTVNNSGTLKLSSFVTSTQITSNQNDYTATDGSNTCSTKGTLRLSSDASRNITGLSCGQAEGDVRILHNVGSNAIVLTNQDAASTAANRFLFGGDMTLAADTSVTIRYDGVTSRWRAITTPGAGGGGGGVMSVAVVAGTGLSTTGTCTITTSGTCTLSWSDQYRQNQLLLCANQAKALAGYQRALEVFCDGYKASDGVNSGSSSNYTVNTTSGYVGPTAGTATTGTWAGTAGVGRTIGVPTGSIHAGFSFTAPATTTISQIKINVPAITTSGTYEARLYTNSGGSPGTQVGTSSGSLVLSTTGDKIFTFGTPPSITNTTVYWIVLANTAGSPDLTLATVTNNASYGSGRNNTITSITDSLPSSEDWKLEITYASGGANMTVLTTAQTADTTVSNGRVLMEIDPVDSITLNTDLTAEVTCNGGTNWATATVSSIGKSQAGRTVVESADTSCGANTGTSFAARIKSLNAKVVNVYKLTNTVH